MIQIEPVKSSEVKTLAAISSKCFYDTFHQQNSEQDMQLCLDKDFNAEKILQEMQQQNNYFFFARADNDITGYLKLADSANPAGIKQYSALEIARIYVVKEKIGSGTGKSLMNFALAFAKQHKKNLVWLGVWEHNHRAVNFYTKYGFEKFGEQTFMLGEDAQTDWLMKKELG